MKYFRKTEISKLKIPVLVITVTEKETAAFMSRFQYLNGQKNCYIANKQTYSIGYFGKYMVAHIRSNMGIGRPDGALLTTYDGLADINPQLILMLGIAFGVNDKEQKIGDVLISEKVFPYELVKVGTQDNAQLLINRNSRVYPDPDVINIFKNFELPGYKVFSGTILSGNKLVDNIDYRNSLIKLSNDEKVVGGEMESCGVAHAAQRFGASKWIIVKSVCDFGDGNKSVNKDKNQDVAAACAVEYCFNIFNSEILKDNLNIPLINSKYLVQEQTPINGYRLFYYRNKKRISFRKLSNATSIKENLLHKYEMVLECNNEIQFASASKPDLIKLEEYFECQGQLENLSTEEEIKNFYANKGKKQFFPVENFQAVFFDFDGTLTQKMCDMSTWQLLWKILGYPDNECISLHRKFSNKEITHVEWCNITKNKFIDKGLTKGQVIECAQKIKLVTNVIETIKLLKKEGVKCFVLSGSINTVIDTVMGSNIKLFDEIQCNKFYYKKGGKLEEIVGTKYDFEGKATYINDVVMKYGWDKSKILFVGNSNNDECVYKSGASTLLINPKLTNAYNRKVWNYIIYDLDNFYRILPFVLPQKYTSENIKHLT